MKKLSNAIRAHRIIKKLRKRIEDMYEDKRQNDLCLKNKIKEISEEEERKKAWLNRRSDELYL